MTALRFALAFWLLNTTLALSQVQHAVLLERAPEALHVTEMFRVDNPSAEQTIRVYVPDAGAGTIQATIESPDTPPARLPLRKTAEAGVYNLTSPAKPGVSILQVGYTLPASERFTGRTFHTAATRLVTSRNVILSGSNVRFLSTEPRSQANLYQLINTEPGKSFEVLIEGTGALNSESSESPASDRQPTRGPARIFERLHTLLALTLSILLIGGTRLYLQGGTTS